MRDNSKDRTIERNYVQKYRFHGTHRCPRNSPSKMPSGRHWGTRPSRTPDCPALRSTG